MRAKSVGPAKDPRKLILPLNNLRHTHFIHTDIGDEALSLQGVER